MIIFCSQLFQPPHWQTLQAEAATTVNFTEGMKLHAPISRYPIICKTVQSGRSSVRRSISYRRELCVKLHARCTRMTNTVLPVMQTDGMARTADEQPLLAELSLLLHVGLHSLHVVSGIGAGKQAVTSHSRAPDVLRLAMKYRLVLLTADQRHDLETWVAKSKVRLLR